jgi:chromosome partitioning protein
MGKKKMRVVTFCQIKGGVGKTTIGIHVANCAAAAGKRVCEIDSDLNNSLGYYRLEDMERTRKKNLAAALSDERNDLKDYTVETMWENVDLIASSPYLADLRTISEKRLSRMTPTLEEKYDLVIIDCHPTYDNIVLNGVNAADYIISPVLKDTFSYNAAVFMGEVLARDTEKIGRWNVLVNGYDKRYEEGNGKQSEYIKLFRKAELPLTPIETWTPWTMKARDVVDYRKKISLEEGISGAVNHAAMYEAISALTRMIFAGEELAVKGVF